MTESADVVIIGSGIAGAMCAWRLGQKGLKVLILEAGPRINRGDIVQAFTATDKLDLSAGFPNPPWAPRPDWSTPKDDYIRQTGSEITRIEYLRVVGGTTWHWNGNSIRLIPSDFRLKSTHGVGVDWPIEYADLELYYVEAERAMGVAGEDGVDKETPRSAPFPLPPLPRSYGERLVLERLALIDMKFATRPVAINTRAYDGRPQCVGFSVCSPICPAGANYSANVHVEKAEALGVRVLENARVDRFEADSDGRIVAAHFARPDGEMGTAAGRFFILAANGLESPRLLLVSANERFPGGLANRSDQVGRNFMDHPSYNVHALMPEPVYFGRGPDVTSVWFDRRDGPFRAEQAAFTIALANRVPLYDIANHYLSMGLLPPELDRTIRNHALRHIEIDCQVEQLPRADNRVSIDWTDRDAAGQPRLVLHYSLGDYERRAVARIQTLFDKMVAALGAREHERSGLYAHHHLMGTLRMGKDPRTSVVDAFCRAHDHPNLYVAGSAVFPTGGTANPTLTIAALALRTADAIARQ